jgi:hypothetical protein
MARLVPPTGSQRILGLTLSDLHIRRSPLGFSRSTSTIDASRDRPENISAVRWTSAHIEYVIHDQAVRSQFASRNGLDLRHLPRHVPARLRFDPLNDRRQHIAYLVMNDDVRVAVMGSGHDVDDDKFRAGIPGNERHLCCRVDHQR